MGEAAAIMVRPVAGEVARAFVMRHHYSGKTVNKSQVHLGAFLGPALVGVLQYGPPLQRSAVLPLVRDTKWHDMLELNRMAMIDAAPRNAESRAISASVRILRRTYPNLEWLLSFSDACQCGDGTIYRAAGWLLTGITKNTTILSTACGLRFTNVGYRTSAGIRAEVRRRLGIQAATKSPESLPGVRRLVGFQLRYLLPLRPGVRERLTVPVLPYTAIDEAGAGMYLGKRREYATEAQ